MSEPLVLSAPRPPRLPALRGVLDQIGVAALVLLPPMLLHARAIADILLSCIAVLLLVRSALDRDWGWTRQAWVRVAAALWAWLVLCSVVAGHTGAILQAAATLRMFVFAAALQSWLLPDARNGRWLRWSVTAMALWIGIEAWQQLLTGHNLMGDPRWGDGALTGPFLKPKAGKLFLQTLFVALLPVAVPLLDRPRRLDRALGIFLMVLAAATMVIIGQRMPTLLMLLGFLAAALLLPRLRLPAALALGAGALLLAATPILSPPTYQKLVVHFTQQMSHFITSDYGLLYVRAVFMTETHPLLGLGFNGFRLNCEAPAFFHGVAWLGVSDAASGGLAGCNIHPHNYFLEFATSAGLPGLALFCVLCVLWLVGVGRRLLPQADPLRVALFAGVLITVWPLAATNEFFVAESAGWVFLQIGWGMALARR